MHFENMGKALSKHQDDMDKQGKIISSSTCTYMVQTIIGQGCFGKVAKCMKLETNTPVAIKILTSDSSLEDAKVEVDMLQRLHGLDPDRNNLVRFYEYFEHQGKPCLVFELLDTDLLNFMNNRPLLRLAEIRPIVQQLLVAFAGLKRTGVIHTDLKLDNIMLVDRKNQPLKVKLIDFGIAQSASDIQTGRPFTVIAYRLLSSFFRAPEVVLGLPLSEAMDMWSLGCVMVNLFVCGDPFDAPNEYEMMRSIMDSRGQPDQQLLNQGLRTHNLFTRDTTSGVWRLKSPEEYKKKSGIEVEQHESLLTNLHDLGLYYKSNDLAEFRDLLQFIDLLEKMLILNPSNRITANEALQHPFITMDHLQDDSSIFVQNSIQAMKVCTQVEDGVSAYPEFCDSSIGSVDSVDVNDVHSLTPDINTESSPIDPDSRPPCTTKKKKVTMFRKFSHFISCMVK
ncbi:homeodomain-interacting protein kinase 2-like [Genypterus blacodes]|uniref:homeodomain-interacting protein kinase 2-like n=1 Tax=Genypterus blacodes TaxID=154954 RepID=UPI003F777A3B